MSKTAWAVHTGEFKHIVVRYEWKEVADSREASFSWEVTGINEDLAVALS